AADVGVRHASSPRRPPRSPLFPYTTLFRSHLEPLRLAASRRRRRGGRGGPRRALAHRPLHHGEVVRRSLRRPDQTAQGQRRQRRDRKSTRLNSSHVSISYAVFRLKKKKPAR